MKRILALLLLFVSAASSAQFTPGQVLTAAQLNSALATKATNAAAAITGGTITGLSAPIPLASGGTGASTATGATGQLQSLQSGAGAVARGLQTKLGDVLAVADFSTGAQAVAAGLGNHLIVPVGTTLTVNVPSNVSTISGALSAISSWEIYGAVYIQVADGTYAMSPLSVTSPFGSQIHIIGDVTTPANCVLQFSGTAGIYVPYGYTLAELNGFYIQNTGTKAGTLGVYSDGGMLSKVGPNLTIDGFYYGLAARNHATINASGSVSAGITVKNGGDVNIWAYQGGQIFAQYATATGAIDSVNNYGSGFLTEFGGVIDATNATATGNYLLGIGAYSDGSVRAENSAVSGNGGATPSPAGYSAGYVALEGGSIEVFGGSTTSNITNAYGYSYDPASSISGVATLTNTGNALGQFFVPSQANTNGTVQFNGGSVTINSTYSGNATSGTAYLDQNIPASNFAIRRFLTNGTEIWRQQFRNDSNVYQWAAGGITGLTYAPLTGAMTLLSLTVTNSVSHGQQEIDKSYAFSTPTTGATVTMASGTETAVIAPAGTLAALTVALPSCTAGYDGSLARYSSSQTITALTVSSASSTVSNAPSTLAPGVGNAYICRGSSTTWYRLY